LAQLSNRFVYYHTKPYLLKWASDVIGERSDFENDPLARCISYIQTEPNGTFTPLAVVVLNRWTHTSVEGSIASDQTTRWASRTFFRAVYDHVFVTHARLRLSMGVSVDNAPAINMHEKLGHVREGLMRDLLGEGRNAFLYAFTHSDYKASKWHQ